MELQQIDVGGVMANYIPQVLFDRVLVYFAKMWNLGLMYQIYNGKLHILEAA